MDPDDAKVGSWLRTMTPENSTHHAENDNHHHHHHHNNNNNNGNAPAGPWRRLLAAADGWPKSAQAELGDRPPLAFLQGPQLAALGCCGQGGSGAATQTPWTRQASATKQRQERRSCSSGENGST